MTSDSNHPSRGEDARPAGPAAVQTVKSLETPDTAEQTSTVGTAISDVPVPDGSTYFRRDPILAAAEQAFTASIEASNKSHLLASELPGEVAPGAQFPEPIDEDGAISDVDKIAAVTSFPGVSAAVLAASGFTEPNQAPPSGARLALVTSNSPERHAAVKAEMDQMSLEQALLDVEVANARVIDLTSRLVEANQRSAVIRAEADALRSQITASQARADAQTNAAHAELAAKAAEIDARAAHLEAQKASTAYRWAAKVWNLRNAIKN
jgi:hypothetical protein